MELRQLKYFLAVADTRSFVSAAGDLYISRQAVSKAVAQLETELGVELFVRDTNGAFLTPAGLMFYDRIRSSVIELEQVREEMQRYGARYHQRIRLAFPVGIMALYDRRLVCYLQEQENVDLECREYSEYDCLEMLREHKADLALCANLPQGPEYSGRLLMQSPYGVLLRRTEELAELESLELGDLSWIPLAGLAGGFHDGVCRKYGLQLRYTGLDLYRLFGMTRAGRCAMLLPQCMLPEEMEDLIWLPLEHVQPWQLYCVHLRSLEHNVLYHTTIDELQNRVFCEAVDG